MQGGSLTPSREAAGHSVVLLLLETVEKDPDTHTWRQPPAGSPRGCDWLWRRLEGEDRGEGSPGRPRS